MPDEPDNLVLIQLRDIRVKLDRMSDEFREMKADNAEFRETFRHQVTYAHGLDTMANLKADEASGKAESALERQKKIVADLKRLEESVAGR